MRILFTSIVGTGHFTPLVPYAQEMQRRGHEVRVAAPEQLAKQIAAAGFDQVPVGSPSDEEQAAFFSQFEHLAPRDRAAFLLGELFVGFLPRHALPALMDFATDWHPDLVVREAGEYAGALAAERLGVPHVRVSVSNGHSFSKSIEPFDTLRRDFGLSPDQGASLKQARAFSTFPASMEPPGADGADAPQFRVEVAQTTPAAEAPDWAQDANKPKIYMTFGTVMGSSDEAKAIFRAALDAVGSLDLSVLMTTGPSMDVAALGAIPGNVTLRDFVPQADVLPHVSAVICHGGSGTILGALAAGLPLVVTPIGADQPDNARAVAAVGAGIAVDAPDADLMAQATRAVLEEPRYKAGAQNIADEMAAQSSIAAAVDEMLHLVETA